MIFFNDTATTEIYTLPLHDALPISSAVRPPPTSVVAVVTFMTCPQSETSLPLYREGDRGALQGRCPPRDRKSTRLNSSHANISYAVFCLKKKTTELNTQR